MTSGRYVYLFLTTVNGLTASQSLPAESLKSMNKGLRAPDRTVISAIFYRHAIDEHAVNDAIAYLQHRVGGTAQLAEGIVESRSGQTGIDLGEGIVQSSLQQCRAVVVTLRIQRAGYNVVAVCDIPADAIEPFECGVINSDSEFPLIPRVPPAD